MGNGLQLPKVLKISKIFDDTYNIKTIYVDGNLPMEPGQFYMVWLPGVDEKPFTLGYTGDNSAITVRKHGRYTKALFNAKVGDKLGFRGPFGNKFTIPKNKRVAVIAGGIGLIAVAPLIECLDPKLTTVIVGAKTKADHFYLDRFKMELCTDDGSLGEKCFSTQLFERLHLEKKFDMVYTCGPEFMMKAVVDLCVKYDIPLEGSMERYMKCGIGVCAACVCGDQLVCRDGPIFTKEQLLKMDDFGKRALLMSGKIATLKEYFAWHQE